MQHDYSCQTSPSKSDQIDWKLDDIIGSEEENTDSASTVIGMKLRNVMSQGEMEILTRWFPKASKTLACVLARPTAVASEIKRGVLSKHTSGTRRLSATVFDCPSERIVEHAAFATLKLERMFVED